MDVEDSGVKTEDVTGTQDLDVKVSEPEALEHGRPIESPPMPTEAERARAIPPKSLEDLVNPAPSTTEDKHLDAHSETATIGEEKMEVDTPGPSQDILREIVEPVGNLALKPGGEDYEDGQVTATQLAARVTAKDFAFHDSEHISSPPGPPLETSQENTGLQAATPTTEGRQLNVTDALSYLDAVKQQFNDRPDVYNLFLDIMKDFKSHIIDTPGVIDRVSQLFAGHPGLIQGFNTFLPAGYRIECTVDAQDTNFITVTTPSGTTTQSTGPTASNTMEITYESVPPQPENIPYTAEQISPAMEYVTRIKQRFADNAELYLEFLDILSMYKRYPVDEVRLASRIAKLFHNAPDLLSDFQEFMPRGILPADEMLASLSSEKEKSLKQMKKKAGENGPSPGPSTVPKRKRKGTEKEREREREMREREREKEREREREERERNFSQGKVKKAKYQHPSDISFQSFPPSPHMNDVPAPPLPPAPVIAETMIEPTADEMQFFDRVKRALDNRDTYNEFLKLINYFTQGIIDLRRLVEQSYPFLGDSDLFAQLKEIIGWDASMERNDFPNENGIPGYTSAFDMVERPAKSPLNIRNGPSYRKLPASEVSVTCSGRDEMCRSVLNDEWVSHPTWASEDSGFVPHKKNAYEEALHRSEEERHEYDFHIEAILRVIAVLEPLNMKYSQFTPDERSTHKLKPGQFGGANRSIISRIIKKIYGKEHGMEVLSAFYDSPCVAVPMILARLKQKEEEWKKAQREWNKVWREVDARNYQKSLDHQGITFKINDKKALTTKTFVNQIEVAREEQFAKRATLINPLVSRLRPRYQLSYELSDLSVLQDLLKLTFSFLDRMHHQINFAERRRIEGFLRTFFPTFFMLDPTSFNDAFHTPSVAALTDIFLVDDRFNIAEDNEDSTSGPSNSRSGRHRRDRAGDLRKKLLKNSAQEKSNRKPKGTTMSNPTSRFSSPLLTELIAVDEQTGDASSLQDAEGSERHANKFREKEDARNGSFFSNTHFYVLLRLIEALYSRLLSCKTLASKLASDPSSPYISSPVASELALLDTEAPDSGLSSLRRRTNPAAYFYDYLLESCERLFDNEIDQQMFEDICRYMFGIKAYVMFSVDKVIGLIIKQVQTIISDGKSIGLLESLQRERELLSSGTQDLLDIREDVEKLIGPEENLFRINWVPSSYTFTVQLLGREDSIYDDTEILTARWQAYIDSYVSDDVTKEVRIEKINTPFLHRNLRKTSETVLDDLMRSDGGLEIKVCARTYQMFFAHQTEDYLWRRIDRSEADTVERRMRNKGIICKGWLERFNETSSVS